VYVLVSCSALRVCLSFECVSLSLSVCVCVCVSSVQKHMQMSVCRVLQRVAVCCSVLQCFALCCSVYIKTYANDYLRE